MNLEFDRAVIGSEVDQWVTPQVTAAEIVEYATTCGETNPLFLDEQAASRGVHGALIAPPTFVAKLRLEQLRERLPFLKRPGFDAGKDIEFGEPIRCGDVLNGTTVLQDLYEKTGRSGVMYFVTLRTTVTNQHDRWVATIDQRMMFR
jgi:acyl dehydratase